MRSLRTVTAVGLGVAFACVVACSANKAGTSTVPGGGNDTGSGDTGAGAGSGIDPGTGNAATGNINTSNNTGGASPDGGCQHVALNFVPKIPSIFILVDRSDSMFTPDPMTQVASWAPLKAGVLDVIGKLQAQIRFGFGAFTGQAGAMCPLFSSIAPALNNAKAISDVYQPLGRVTGAKGETPVMLTLPLVRDLLNQPGNDGDKYILFVTDGEPDFCDDGDSACPVDAVVGRVQGLAAGGIHTIVFGLPSAETAISGPFLQAMANAGESLPVVAPFPAATKDQNVCYGCSPVAGWKAEWTALGSAPDCQTVGGKRTLGTYSPAGGTATVYHPNPNDQDALTKQISSVVQGIKSCTFDLNGKVSVNLALLPQSYADGQASVSIEGTNVPMATDNGWHMTSDTQLELVGAACDTWRKPESAHIDFNFPCDIIVPK